MSVRLAATYALLRATNTKNTESLQSLEWRVVRDRSEAPPTKQVLAIADISTREVNGCPVLRVTPRTRATGRQIIYLHGGAYVGPMIKPHWSIITSLLAATGATVTIPQYALAPDHHADEAYELIESVYNAVAQNAKRIFLVGDSAGAGLAVGEAIKRRDVGKSAPTALILFSPWLDVAMSNPEIERLVAVDPMLGPVGLAEAGRWWAGERDVRDPLVSPLYDSLTGLPPMYIYQGGRDIFLPDVTLFADKANAAGSSTTLTVTPRGFHVFVGAPWLPEARDALADAARVISQTE